jgi:hypothetical protein
MMDSSQFDQFTRSLTGSRRSLLGGSLALGAGWRGVSNSNAKKARKHRGKKVKLRRNAFGCVDVGAACQGNSANCCSGICEGKKPKKGKKDTSVCVGHDDAGVCFADSDSCTVGGAVPCNPGKPKCFCQLTTGNAAFCGDFTDVDDYPDICRICSKDIDCEPEFGPGAACLVLAGACTTYCAATGRTACVPPCA